MVFFAVGNSVAQEQQDVLSKPYQNTSFQQFAEDYGNSTGIKFYFKTDWIKEVTVTGDPGESGITVIRRSLEKAGLSAIFRDHYVIVLPDASYSDFIKSVSQMDRTDDQNVVMVGDPAPFDESAIMTITGFLKDGKREEGMVGATIYFKELGEGVASDVSGRYEIKVPPGIYTVQVNNVGYEPTETTVVIYNSGSADFDLFESSINLDALTITAEAEDNNVSSTEMGVATLDLTTIKKIPAFMGEADIVKTLLYLPGVSSPSEGNAGFSVRGGKTDQNLILFDNVPVYNSSHLFGFFTNINPDVVDGVKLYKGAVPARYGGRISSVLEIGSKDPDMNRYQVKGGVGVLSSKVVAELPIIKERSSIMIGGRGAYANWILNSFNDPEINDSQTQFYDLNGKWSTYIGERDKITVTGYLSHDEFKFAADTTYAWDTQNAAIRWDRIFNDRLSMSLNAFTGAYDFTISGLVPTLEFDLNSGIRKRSALADFTYELDGTHVLNAGGSMSLYNFTGGSVTTPSSSTVDLVDIQNEYGREVVGYLSDDIFFNSIISASVGVRYAHYTTLGSRDLVTYESGQPRNANTVADTLIFDDNDEIVSYSGFEPRVSLKVSLSRESSIKASYNRHQQFVRTLTNTVGITPIDIWKSSDTYIPQEISDQYSIGYFRNFNNNGYETSVEFYYRDMSNVIDFKNGTRFLLNPSIEQDILVGNGRAYGVEVYGRKNEGKLTGWFSYTYSRTEKQIEGEFDEETINDGKFFPAEFDQPHNLSIVGNYQLTQRASFNFNFTYVSGRPFTAPQLEYLVSGQVITYFFERNNSRIPDYHRLDLGVTLEASHKKRGLLAGSWTFSIYNLYGRRNAYSVFVGDRYTRNPKTYQLSVLGNLVPSLTYNFYFK